MLRLEIESFLRVVHCGSLTKASEELFITQPALSHRISTLEKELGYLLFNRQPGVRNIALTPQGAAFVDLAEKFGELWLEAQQLKDKSFESYLRISAIFSINIYIMPAVYRLFMEDRPDVHLHIHDLHSAEAYREMEQNNLDLSFIVISQFSKFIKTQPLFSEKMCFVCNADATYPPIVDPKFLDYGKSLEVPWNLEYEMWCTYWFGRARNSWIQLENFDLLDDFLQLENSWSIVPATVANKLARNPNLRLCQMTAAPPDRITYYLTNGILQQEKIDLFLSLLRHVLDGAPGVTMLF